MNPWFTLHPGNCLDVMKTMADNSVDAVVTDPPYGLSFMGKKWDYDVPSVEIWAECLRVLKPGGHLLAFAGTRTQHRMAVRIEDAGFEIRDMIAWVYGSGFPKSLDVSKAIDKRGGASVAWFGPWFRKWREDSGVTQKQVAALFPSKSGGLTGCVANWELGFNMPTPDQFNLIRDTFSLPFASVEEAEREVVAQQRGTMLAVSPGQDNDRSATTLNVTAPATYAASQWAGWGTALKPALEPITVARKPLAGTVAENVLAHGTGAINVDGCRVAGEATPINKLEKWSGFGQEKRPDYVQEINTKGRWPANIIHDGSDEVIGLFPVQDDKSAARFFYCPKANKRDRNDGLDNTHTVKYVIPGSQLKGELSCKDASTALAQSLSRVMSESTLRWNIGESGASIMGLCPSDSLFTTLTAISRITPSEILNLLPHCIINGFTADASCETESGGSLVVSADRSNRLIPTTTGAVSESAPGASLVVSQMLSAISDAANWKPSSNTHSTVKPTDLMRYLCRLVTPPSGVVLDPFMGSGSTGKAAALEGFRFIGIELDPGYFEIAKRRIESAASEPQKT